MTVLKLACTVAAAAAVGLPSTVLAQIRAKADLMCTPTAAALQYDCTVTLTDSRTNQPLSGVTVTLGADMPSMPMMHNVRPVTAPPGPAPGTYQARLVLEMLGDWALQLNLSGPLRDRIVTVFRFEAGRATRVVQPAGQPGHKH